ncbi:MAG: ATP-binding protein [Candidatus Melainabacteria bacterium]|nr:MAG: ATP-binding protein [Candidatus Melainabacteria bacterium]
MDLVGKSLQTLSEADLQLLISLSISENSKIEYKQQLPEKHNDAKHEFLKDICAMVNGGGGDIVYGIGEDRKSGKPTSVFGIELKNWDSESRHWKQLIDNGIEPRIHGWDCRTIELTCGRVALVLRLPQSIYGAHQVVAFDDYRFYKRVQASRHVMTYLEIQTALLFADANLKRARQLRDERVSTLANNSGYQILHQGPILALHLIPIGFDNPERNRSLTEWSEYLELAGPPGLTGVDHRYTVDGIMTFKKRDYTSLGYLHLGRSGVIEAVSTYIFRNPHNERFWRIDPLEEGLIRSLDDYVNLLKKQNVQLPVLLSATIINAQGYSLHFRSNTVIEDKLDKYIDRQILQLPEILIRDWQETEPIAKFVKPLIEGIWNSCGWSTAASYEGNERVPKDWIYCQD